MKHPVWVMLGIFYAGAPVARAHDEGGPLLSPVELELQNASTDDQIIRLARAAKVNIMADASDEPQAGQPEVATKYLSVAKKQTLLEWMLDISYANRLTWQRQGSAIVMWKAPDVVPLARRIVESALAQRPQIEAEMQPALRLSLDPELVARLDAEPAKWSQATQKYGLYNIAVTDSLAALLRKKHGWDGQNQDFQLQLRDEEIPATLRAQLTLYRRQAQAQPNLNYSAWLRDETWQKARLTVTRSGRSIINGQEQPRQWALNVVAPVDGTGMSARRSVATLATEEGGRR